MNYTFWELALFFFIYAFIFWAGMTICVSLYKGQFINAGLLYGPVMPGGALAVTISVWLIRDTVGNYIVRFLLCTVVCLFVKAVTSRFHEKVSGITPEGFLNTILTPLGKAKGIFRILIPGALCVMAIALLHPFVLMLTSVIIAPVQKVLVCIFSVIFLADMISSGLIFRKLGRINSRMQENVVRDLDEITYTLGNRIEHALKKRLYKTYPEMEASAKFEGGLGVPGSDRIFAKGYGFIKFFWVFLTCAFAGDIAETIYCRIVGGTWMSRSSFLYGPFSIVWGLGAALGTAALLPLSRRNDRWVFFGGFFLGGAYEYLCSVFTEVVFGQVFWDYSDYPLNIDGRTNVLYMFFWGIGAVVLIKFLYPLLCRIIEKIPPLPGLIATWVCLFLIILDILVTGLALGRFRVRQSHPEAKTQIEEYLDTQFPDAFMVKHWPNMVSTQSEESAD